MTDRRAVRSVSRRTAPPTPQPAASTAHASRKRVTRSASRDVEPPLETERPTRRSARQASVTGIASENEQDNGIGGRLKHKPMKQSIGDLTMVEELDTEIHVRDAAQTPPRPATQGAAVPHRSPSGVSEISGTTAISSLSMVEADLLEPRFLLRHLPKLYSVVDDFLNLLVPEGEDALSMQDRLPREMKRIQDMQMPDSELVEDYNDFDTELGLHLKYFRGNRQQFIDPRVIHQALFGPENRSGARTGLDLILYRTNLLILVKDMIHSDRSDKIMWTTIRTLENLYPSLFLHTLDPRAAASTSVTGDSALLQQTFELALDFRTQLAILYLQREFRAENFDPDVVLNAVFFGKDDVNRNQKAPEFILGWSVPALGGEDAPLPKVFRSQVVARLNEIRNHFPTDTQALEHGDVVNFDTLGATFMWRSVILRLLYWVRLRNAELRAAISHCGGSKAIEKRVIVESKNPKETSEPQEKRVSYGQKERRSSRKFDLSENLDNAVLERVRAGERNIVGQGQIQNLDEGQNQRQDPPKNSPPRKTNREVEAPQAESQVVEIEHQSTEALAQGDDWYPPLDDDDPTHLGDVDEEPVAEPVAPPRRPTSTADFMKLLSQPKKVQKENRVKRSIFDSQPGAVRVEWDEGFGSTSQPAVASSSRQHVPERSTKSKKRPAPEDSDEDSHAFETARRTEKIEKRREKARRVRLEVDPPASSAAPTSHQPRRPVHSADIPTRIEPDTSVSEPDGPEMTEAVPPSSGFALQREQARINSRTAKPRKRKEVWTMAEEDAFIEYMRRFPGNRYAEILKYDASEAGYQMLSRRDQVALKDKARNMAANMIKSGSGLRPGFEQVIDPNTALGRSLLAKGFDW